MGITKVPNRRMRAAHLSAFGVFGFSDLLRISASILGAGGIATTHTNPKRKRGNVFRASLTLRVGVILVLTRYGSLARGLAIILTCLLLARAAYSAPPELAKIPSDSLWFVHVDFDVLRKATVYEKLVKTALPRWKPIADGLAKIDTQLGLNLAKDLHGVTVFGPEYSEAKANVVMRADWDVQTFRRKIALAPDYSVATEGRYEIHRFTRPDGEDRREVAGAVWQPGTFVFGQSSKDVRAVLDVLDDQRPHLRSDSPLTGEFPTGTILLVRLIAAKDGLPGDSPLLRQSERMELLGGEDAGECFLRGRLLTKSEKAAQDVKTTVDGFLAMVRLQAAAGGADGKLLEHVQVRADGRTLRIDFHAPADDVVKAVGDLTIGADRPKGK